MGILPINRPGGAYVIQAVSEQIYASTLAKYSPGIMRPSWQTMPPSSHVLQAPPVTREVAFSMIGDRMTPARGPKQSGSYPVI